MLIIEEISKSGCDDEKLLNYVCENYDQIECELNGDEYVEPKKLDCNLALTARWH